jgi:hypothetical protein
VAPADPVVCSDRSLAVNATRSLSMLITTLISAAVRGTAAPASSEPRTHVRKDRPPASANDSPPHERRNAQWGEIALVAA